jgi:hypothetical protein
MPHSSATAKRDALPDTVSDGNWLPHALIFVTTASLIVRALITVSRWDGFDIGKYFFADDAFYYLKIAQNVARGRGSTFDGSVPTNGYHPLWELCCVALQALWPHAGARMAALVYVTQLGLLLVAALSIYRGLRETSAWAAALTALLLALNTISALVLVDGMESGLVFTLLAVYAQLAATRRERFLDLREPRYAAGMLVLLVALSLTRLEAALFAALFVAAALIEGVRRRGRQLRNTLFVLGGLIACAAAYVASNFALVGLPLPVSGLVKALWPPDGPLYHYLLVMEVQWFVSPLRVQQALERGWLTAGLAGALLVGLVWFVRDALRRKQSGLLLLVGGCAALIAQNLLFTRQAFHWYGWPALMLGTLCTFGLLSRVLPWALPRTGWAAAALTSLAVAYAVLINYRFVTRAYDRLYDWNTAPSLMDSARRFIDEQIPRDAILAGDSVGLLAYVTGRGIINVEGLVEDRAYYRALQQHSTGELLRQRGVTWLMLTQPNDAVPACARTRSWTFADNAPVIGGTVPRGTVRFYQLDYSVCDAQRSGTLANTVE